MKKQIKQTPEPVESLLRINSVSKHLERIADMATNIAEDVIYMVEGEIVRHRQARDAAAEARGAVGAPAAWTVQALLSLSRARS